MTCLMKRINLKTKLASWLQVGCKAAREEQFCLGSTITYPKSSRGGENTITEDNIIRWFDPNYTEVLVFGGAKVPWGTREEGNMTGAISLYIR